jgi:hypothetical protein
MKIVEIRDPSKKAKTKLSTKIVLKLLKNPEFTIKTPKNPIFCQGCKAFLPL